ncbi:uncharacterized protein LOC124156124 [Ischnura elegans]|uniref:uncharacterized protein LOC124156124 n=1 Tax=Ischnura elegans TaxID=197161 RepID=UPI001ED86793|nr:uncharacterized protein LOC124156124 [Ischnura elegans]
MPKENCCLLTLCLRLKDWDTWTEGGPKGCRYNRSKSGWFDSAIFEEWFFSLVLPRLRKQDGVKVLLGDNLASHINHAVIKECQENHIHFVCLPPHSTHLTQPLDVAYFHPMKVAWRCILQEWRRTAEGERFTTLPKDNFAKLLNQLFTRALNGKGQNLISGFRKCGICPLNRNEVLKRLPREDRVNPDLIGDAFMQALLTKRADAHNHSVHKKRKRLNIEPGKSICPDDLEETSSRGSSVTPESTQQKKRGRPKKKIVSNDSDTSDDFNGLDNLDFCTENGEVRPAVSTDCRNGVHEQDSHLRFKKGDYVAVKYNGDLFPGRIIELPRHDQPGPSVECMEKHNKFWRWPEKKDVLQYDWEDIKQTIFIIIVLTYYFT